jgi:tetratricopeptide (TPR) repeat protein
MNDKLKAPVFILILLMSTPLFSLSFFENGEKLFLDNRPEEALVMLEAALGEERDNELVYLYLGIIYEQLGEYGKAVSILELGLPLAGNQREKFYFNLGNNYFSLDNHDRAEEMYSKIIDVNTGYSSAYLNRANTRMQMEKYKEAVTDYTRYLSLRPSAPQKKEIQQLINILTAQFADEERMKAEEERRKQEALQREEEEARKRLEEETRRKEEERRREEEARRRQEELLQQVLNSLENAADDTTSFTAGSESIEVVEEELDIPD